MSGEKNLNFLDQFEIGGTFFELIEFGLNRNLPGGRTMRGIYGVNVAKVREVVHMPEINPLGSSVPGVAGIFELRGVPIPAINLCLELGDTHAQLSKDQQIIVTEFCNKRAGFIVSSTHRIRRVAWDKVLPPSGEDGSNMTGMILIEDNEFLFILDLEKIISSIEQRSGEINKGSPFAGVGAPAQTMMMPVAESTGDGHKILFMDDSKLVLNNVARVLKDSGYQVVTARDGQDGLDKLQLAGSGKIPGIPAFDLIITDVEMPVMDGLTMVTRIREMGQFDSLPVLLHTSLSSEVTLKAAQSVGANGYVVKNDVRNLLDVLQDMLGG